MLFRSAEFKKVAFLVAHELKATSMIAAAIKIILSLSRLIRLICFIFKMLLLKEIFQPDLPVVLLLMMKKIK